MLKNLPIPSLSQPGYSTTVPGCIHPSATILNPIVFSLLKSLFQRIRRWVMVTDSQDNQASDATLSQECDPIRNPVSDDRREFWPHLSWLGRWLVKVWNKACAWLFQTNMA